MNPAITRLCSLLILALSSTQTFANTLLEARENYQQDKFEEALEILQNLEQSDEVNQLTGLTLFHLLEHDKARPLLEASLKQTGSHAVAVALAEILLEEDKPEKAIELLSPLELSSQQSFLLGRAYAQQNMTLAAIKQLKQASSMDEDLSQQVDLELARVYYRAREFDKALATIKQSIAEFPGSFESGTLKQLQHTIVTPAATQFNAEIAYQLEWNSNVALRPKDSSVVLPVNGESDFRNTFSLDISQQNTYTPRLKLFSELHLTHMRHPDLDLYDESYLSGTVSPIWLEKQYTMRMPIEFDWNLRQDQSYERTIRITPGVTTRNSKGITSHMFAKLQRSFYDTEFANIDEDLNGMLYAVGALVYAPYPKQAIDARILAQFGYHDVDGDNWKRYETVLLANLRYSPIRNVKIDLFYQFGYSSFVNLISDFLEDNRHNTNNAFSGKIAYRFFRNWEVYGLGVAALQNASLSTYQIDRFSIASGVVWQY